MTQFAILLSQLNHFALKAFGKLCAGSRTGGRGGNAFTSTTLAAFENPWHLHWHLDLYIYFPPFMQKHSAQDANSVGSREDMTF